MSDSAGNWCLIESDPGVFTELIKEFGISIFLTNLQIIVDFIEVMYVCFFQFIQVAKVFKLKSSGVWMWNNSKIYRMLKFTISNIDWFNIYSVCFDVIFRPVHGVIFLFKYVQDDEPAGSVVRDSRLEKIFFAKQVFIPFVTFIFPCTFVLKWHSVFEI